MKPLSSYARIATLIAHAFLVMGLLLWTRNVLGALVAALLLPALPGLWQGRVYTYQWLSLLLCFYSAALLTEGVASPARKDVAWLLAGGAALEFCAVVLFVRLTGRERIAQTLTAQTAGSGGASG